MPELFMLMLEKRLNKSKRRKTTEKNENYGGPLVKTMV